MIDFRKGDLLLSECRTLGCLVNLRGSLTTELQRRFSRTFSGLEAAYQEACLSGELRVDWPWLYRALDQNALLIAAWDDPAAPPQYPYLEWSLEWIARRHGDLELTSLALAAPDPQSGLEWPRVKRLLQDHLEGIPMKVEVYEP
jgi:hypothetical protein